MRTWHNKNIQSNKIWVDQVSEFYNKSFKWLEDNYIEMYSTYNKRKSVDAERFIRTFKNKIYIWQLYQRKVYFDVLNDIVDKYNNTYHTTIKVNHIDVKFNSYAEYNVESNAKDAKFKIGDDVRLSKHKNIFARGYAPNWSEEVFLISKIKNTVPWTYVINDLNGEEIIGMFYEK